MTKINGTNQKMCSFYASDYHFEMISIPFIKEKLNENKNVMILTENDLEPTLQILLSRMNLPEEEKVKITKINWKQDDFTKLKEIKKSKEEDKFVIFIKGREDYIQNINKNIESSNKTENIEIIDCYDMNETGNDISHIVHQYERVLNTTGNINI